MSPFFMGYINKNYMRAKFVNEAIKHLTPRSQEELDKYAREFKTYDKKVFACLKNKHDLTKTVIRRIYVYTHYGLGKNLLKHYYLNKISPKKAAAEIYEMYYE